MSLAHVHAKIRLWKCDIDIELWSRTTATCYATCYLLAGRPRGPTDRTTL